MWENLVPNRFMKIKIGQFCEIADILLQVHAYYKESHSAMASNGRKGCTWGMFVVYQS